jgi:hypothetical protein
MAATAKKMPFMGTVGGFPPMPPVWLKTVTWIAFWAETSDLQHFYRRKVVQKGFAKARVAAARKLGIRLWIMLRDQIDYAEFCRRGLARQS